MSESMKHPFMDLAEEVAAELKITDLEKKVDSYAEREPKEGDIDTDALDAVLNDKALTTEDKEKIVKIINLIADAGNTTGQDMFFEIMAIYMKLVANQRDAMEAKD